MTTQQPSGLDRESALALLTKAIRKNSRTQPKWEGGVPLQWFPLAMAPTFHALVAEGVAETFQMPLTRNPGRSLTIIRLTAQGK